MSNGTGLKVKDIMSRRVLTIDLESTVKDAAKKMARGRVGSIIVEKSGKPIGIITDSDIIKKIVAKDKVPSSVKVEELMSTPLIIVKPDDDVSVAKEKMIKNRIKRLPVVEKGEVVGILTTTDIAMTLPDMVEVLRERLLSREEESMIVEESMAGICEVCGNYSEDLRMVNGLWVCEVCREEREI
ncbi:MAG: CBS domain-containing protein [Candidatus Aenigmarchaeota archaeon]|nr:CBS domain-containing protein [Candidatus Aenigmarchaeota archaeon]